MDKQAIVDRGMGSLFNAVDGPLWQKKSTPRF
jgi:hypothetical protein